MLAAAAAAKSSQLCPTLCDPIDSSPPGSSVHGVFQARVLEWGAIAFSGENHEWLPKHLPAKSIQRIKDQSQLTSPDLSRLQRWERGEAKYGWEETDLEMYGISI